jgi:hypothetical protein
MPQKPERADAWACRSAEHIAVDVDGDLSVVLQTASGVYYELDRVSRRIWALVAQPISVDALCETLVDEYNIEREHCEADVARLLKQLVDAGLLTLSGSSDMPGGEA